MAAAARLLQAARWARWSLMAQPAEAQAVLTRAHALREAIYRLMLARIQGQAADPADLERLNGELPAALARARLEPTGQGYTLGWAPDPQALDRMLWPIAYSAADLLTNPDLLERVGQCADDRGCGWLFLDLTKNRSRRWCAMRGCGNRAKAARHYQRRQGE